MHMYCHNEWKEYHDSFGGMTLTWGRAVGHYRIYDQLPKISCEDGFPGPLQHVHQPLDTLEKLRAAAQLAIQVEWTTIPAYLTALYSIKDTASDAYQALRSVAVEEMFHVNQAANLLVAIGGKPQFINTADEKPVVPRYPTNLPSANQDTTPYVGLYRASKAVFRTVFMGIETPAPYQAPAEGENYSTIAQLYKAVEDALAQAVATYGEAAVFQEAEGYRQRTDIYVGKFGGHAIEITNLKSAQAAIKQVVQQGEGAVTESETLNPLQRWGEKNYYGMRADQTYGPIMGTPWELSHYFKFLKVAEADGFPDTYPIVSNPKAESFLNPRARRKNRVFNAIYTVMLKCLQESFRDGEHGRDIYFQLVLPLMHSAMPKLAQSLMNTPIDPKGAAEVGPNAAPTFEYLTDLDRPFTDRAVEGYRTRDGDLRQLNLGLEQVVGTLTAALSADGELSDDDKELISEVKEEISELEAIARQLLTPR